MIPSARQLLKEHFCREVLHEMPTLTVLEAVAEVNRRLRSDEVQAWFQTEFYAPVLTYFDGLDGIEELVR